MTKCDYTNGYDFTEHTASGGDVGAAWMVVVLVNLCLLVLTT